MEGHTFNTTQKNKVILGHASMQNSSEFVRQVSF
jgi:hypothetical protein